MKSGKCPMCNSNEVYSNSESEFRASGDIVQLSDIDNELQIYLIPYICTNCGFAAMFVADMDDVKDLPETDGWKKVK
ncbi:MAG: hypothetical protein HOP27_07635 [Anaerolineales bacterium]|nr:hypothetical protein [Anaerolineales bacterium]